MDGCKYDRLSDLSCFWGANDPFNTDFFASSDWRDGIFEHYNTLDLWYVGFGENHNTATRFRRYCSKFYGISDERIKPLLQEYTDMPHLLKPGGQWYHVVIKVSDGMTSYTINGEKLFQSPYVNEEGDGYFGLRLFQNHVRIVDFVVKLNH